MVEMKLHRILALSGTVLLGQSALAGELPPDAKALGIAEAISSYCAKVDPSAAPQYRDKVKLVAKGASDEVLAKVRKSDEYQKAHQSVDDFVGKVDEHNVGKVCTHALARSK
jgi:hypothetical protein